MLDIMKHALKGLLLMHLKEFMADNEPYSWDVVRAYHAVCLQQFENGSVEWINTEAKMEFRRLLVCHSALCGSKAKE